LKWLTKSERIGSQRSDASLAVASYPEYGIALIDAARRSQVPRFYPAGFLFFTLPFGFDTDARLL